MRTTTTALSAALGLMLLAGTATPLAAQQKPITFDARGGLGLPTGDLGQVAEVGPAFGIDVNFGVSERLFVRVGGGAELYPGVDLDEALGSEGINDLEVNLVHLDAGILYELTRRDGSGFFASVNATGGLTNLNVPRVETSVGPSAVEIDISELYPTANVGVTGGYAVSEQVDVYLDAQGYAVFGDEADTDQLVRVFNDRMQDDLDGLSTLTSVPLTAGLRLHF